MPSPIIAVVGDGTVPEGSPAYALAERLGGALVHAGFRVLTGGLGGIMEAASRGAARSPDHRRDSVIALLPGHDPDDANPHMDVALATGLGHARNPVVAHAEEAISPGGGPFAGRFAGGEARGGRGRRASHTREMAGEPACARLASGRLSWTDAHSWSSPPPSR